MKAIDTELNAQTNSQFGKWISIKDQLPEEGAKVIAYIGYYSKKADSGIVRFVGTDTFNTLKEWECDNWFVTHWMPFPAPPEDE